jgi:CRISPR-associated protein Cas1
MPKNTETPVTVALHQMLNTLYVTAQRAYLHADHATLKVEVDGKTALQVPLHHLGAVVCFGNVLVSPGAIERCLEEGRSIAFFTHSGKFLGRLAGPTSGNVLLRLAQYQAYNDRARSAEIARAIVAGKLQNTRQVLLRGARRLGGPAEAALRSAAGALARCIESLPRAPDLDAVRGIEGEGASIYFAVLGQLIVARAGGFSFDGRNRRPPRDPVNALISFLYALLLNDCAGALEGVGLDPQLGFLHAVRPGRPSLALDLMEEFRAVVADRLALTLINRGQLTERHFSAHAGGAIRLSDEGRRVVLRAYQERKREETYHRVLDRKVPVGLLPHVQARLLARHLREDLPCYLPYLTE